MYWVYMDSRSLVYDLGGPPWFKTSATSSPSSVQLRCMFGMPVLVVTLPEGVEENVHYCTE